MNKNILKIIVFILIISFLMISGAGCYGKFQLSHKLYKWNGEVGDKWVNSAVMWILFIVPVYEVVGFIDFVILNVIEFWTGENPVTMGPNDMETQMVTLDGIKYEITATQNRFDIKQFKADETFNLISLIYDEATSTWYVEDPVSGTIKIAQYEGKNSNILKLFQPGGETTRIDLNSNQILENN